MGRVKLQLKKIENKAYKHITFAKRRNGLVKKAYELSTLCDVEVALIIFSPAGNLTLFEGKKRVEEVLSHFIQTPAKKRGCLPNQELRQIISQLNLEASVYCHNTTFSGNCGRTIGIVSVDSELEDVQNQILICNSQLQDVERELQYFVKSPSCIKSLSDLEYHEKILEDTLQVVRMHKEALEAHNSILLTLEEPIYPPSSCSFDSSLYFGSYNLMNWPSQDNHQLPKNFAHTNGFQPLRNGPETLVGPPPSSLTYLQGHGFLCGPELNYMPDQVTANEQKPGSRIVNFSPGMEIRQQATAVSSTIVRNMGCNDSNSNL
ncbi:hypothetical protein SLEP1_g8270 [Rubroshorea leprosula]|uniref:MADS-box domain-containing protein n=1 Tax=Rubroshorea leprosula TaxID=152421 RepID=A0AAV5I739_9ROSI|nr:hypothetical protein SLEP1_g8270 [Rubroshorea leprosula]